MYVRSANELYHYGVKGMKWGVRRTPAQLGHKVRQRDMDYATRQKYASVRIKKRGAMQAIQDESDHARRVGNVVLPVVVGGHLGFGSLTMGSLMTGNYPVAIASGAAWAGSVLGGMSAANTVDRNSNRNIDEIKRQGGIADYTTSRRPRG